jgi:hypothetical protein
VSNVALWKVGFQQTQTVLFSVSANKGSSTSEYWILTRELGYANPSLSPPSKGYKTTHGTDANLQQRTSATDTSVMQLLNRLSSCCLSADFFVLTGL